MNPLDLVVVVQIDRRHGRRPAVDGRTPEAGMMDAADWPGRGPASAASRVPQASTRGWKHGQHMRSVDKLCVRCRSKLQTRPRRRTMGLAEGQRPRRVAARAGSRFVFISRPGMRGWMQASPAHAASEPHRRFRCRPPEPWPDVPLRILPCPALPCLPTPALPRRKLPAVVGVGARCRELKSALPAARLTLPC